MSEFPRQYLGKLTSDQAAAALQAAGLNARYLLESAECLFREQRHAHSMALATLSIEESCKAPILLRIFLNVAGQEKAWGHYRKHTAKTAWLSTGIASFILATDPDIGIEEARSIGADGPEPHVIEKNKQLAIYSDCLDGPTGFVCHLPAHSPWEVLAWERLCEARAFVEAYRDRTPEELATIKRHVDRAREQNRDSAAMLAALEADLIAQGHIQPGWWDPIRRQAASAPGAPARES